LPEQEFCELGRDPLLKSKYHFNDIQEKGQGQIDPNSVVCFFTDDFWKRFVPVRKLQNSIFQKG